MSVKVMKFGGTSMGSPAAISQVIDIVRAQKDERVAAVVVSAMSGTTDQLIALAHAAAKKDSTYKKMLKAIKQRHIDAAMELMGKKAANAEWIDQLFRHLETAVVGVSRLRELNPGTLDYIMSFGERLSGHLLTDALNARRFPAEYLNARDIIATDEHFGAAKVDFEATNKATRKRFKDVKKLQVVTGFIAATPDRKTTTLGRGGSDYTAAIVGAAISASVIEIWTDVSGIMTADPRLVKEAKVVPELAFEEAAELAYFGAKVLHPKTILPAMRKHIPVKILNTFRPKDAGSTIVSNFSERKGKSHTIEAVSCKRPVLVMHVNSPEFFDVNGFMGRIFEIFDRHHTSVDVVTTSVTSVSLTFENEKNARGIIREMKKLGEVSIERDKAIICAVGGALNVAATVGRMFSALAREGISAEMISQEASNVSITFVVHKRDAEKAIKILHREYIEV